MRRIHFVGIGGIGMSGLAEVLHAQGFDVRGSDLASSDTIERIRSLGVPVAIGHTAENVRDAEIVVYSSAVNPFTNVEVLEAHQRGALVLRRAEMLAQLTRLGKSVAIAGTHGKTTTTSLCGLVLIKAGLDPTVIVGGRLQDFGGSNARLGKGEWFVVEADEYDRSFLQLLPTYAVITNIEAEHLDIYGSQNEIEDAFVEFALKVPFYGAVIACGDDRGVRSILSRVQRRIVTYGFSGDCDLRAENWTYTEHRSRARVLWQSQMLGELELQVPGKHNMSNALAAVAVGVELGIPFDIIKQALATFTGVLRRFQVYRNSDELVVVDDYAHHPTELQATLTTARCCYPQRRIITVFQPHTYTRTRDFAAEFARALLASDIAIVTGIYAAREAPIEGIDGELIVRHARDFGHQAAYFAPTFEHVHIVLDKLIGSGDVVLTLGAGNIYRIAEQLSLKHLSQQNI